ncbi:MAG: hypothetical protein MUF00_08770 [Gemmatimonadaceae bacterium]|jgi:hypothetical protein|nr:hypothetical protein [Gemmatimonadaceae bacterium]
MTDRIVQFECFTTLVAHNAFLAAWDGHTRRRIPAQVATAHLYSASGQGAPYRYISRCVWQPGEFDRAHPDGRMQADRTTGDIHATRIGGYRTKDGSDVLDVGRDESILVALVPAGMSTDAVRAITTPVRHWQSLDACHGDQKVGAIIEWFVAQDQAHRLRRELQQYYPASALGVYQQALKLDVPGVRRDTMTQQRAAMA